MPSHARTETAILGALSVQPMTGYEVRAAIRDTLGHFWHESFGQIYPTLTRLKEAGLVRDREAARSGGSVVQLTGAGRARLRELLAEPHVDRPPRNGLLLRLFFGEELGREASISLLQQAHRDAGAALDRFAVVRAEIGDDVSAGQRYRTMTLSYGEHVARAQRDWAAACLAELGATPGEK